MTQATVIATSPAGDAAKPLPCVSISTPASPRPMPASSTRPGRSPHSRFSAAIISGTTAMKATTSPEPTLCSA
ncbi:hypothetical protein ABXN37_18770 [Piscinibacter sakaiensis]